MEPKIFPFGHFFTNVCFVVLLHYSCSQLTSPCPRLFKYEPKGAENDRWYGTVTLLSDSELSGVWLRLILDKPSIQIGNWFGEVVTTDNKEYLIKNRNHKVMPNTPYNLRFYVKYNPTETPPQLTSFRLNAKTVCPEGGVTTEAAVPMGQEMTSSVLSTTSNPLPFNNANPSRPAGGGGGSSFGGAGGFAGFGGGGGGDEDDFFHGDFAIIQNPQKPTPVDFACGTVVTAPRPLITHGQETHEGEFPWHVALYHSKGSDLVYICGASLISKYHLITVAHCVTRRKSNTPLDTSSLVVYLGKYYLKRWSNAGIQDRHAERIIVHPKYNPQSFSDDIAVIRMNMPVEITNYVRPVCLWDEDLQLHAVVNKIGTVVGWGFDETGRVTEQLTKAKMPVVAQDTCIYSFPEFYSRFTSSKTYCAGFKNEIKEYNFTISSPLFNTRYPIRFKVCRTLCTSVCNGDSGGGMVFPKSNSNPNNPVWQLRGLVSISVALQNQLKCDASHYVVFTDVAKYLDWIKTVLN